MFPSQKCDTLIVGALTPPGFNEAGMFPSQKSDELRPTPAQVSLLQ